MRKCWNFLSFFFSLSLYLSVKAKLSDFENARIFAWFIYETHVFVLNRCAITVTNVAWGYRRYQTLLNVENVKMNALWKGFGFSSFLFTLIFSIEILYTPAALTCTENWDALNDDMTMFNGYLAFYACHRKCLSGYFFRLRSFSPRKIRNMKIWAHLM